MAMKAGIDRFVRAQDDPHAGFAVAMAELQAGRKTGHWIWYIFPQLAGLGSSSQSQHYGLAGIDEATALLEHPVLGARLLDATTAVDEQIARGVPLRTLMGSSIDLQKLVSSLTLFEAAASRLYERDGRDAYLTLLTLADRVLMAAFTEGYQRCQYTLARLRQ
jgi:uncharacterized protein (DUF1810 family)